MFFNNEFVHQVLLYTGNDQLQYTFRVELRMKDDVDQEALRYAVDCTMQRYAYLAVKTEENGAEIDIFLDVHHGLTDGTGRYVDSVVEYFKEYNIEYSFEGKDEIMLPTQKVF